MQHHINLHIPARRDRAAAVTNAGIYGCNTYFPKNDISGLLGSSFRCFPDRQNL